MVHGTEYKHLEADSLMITLIGIYQEVEVHTQFIVCCDHRCHYRHHHQQKQQQMKEPYGTPRFLCISSFLCEHGVNLGHVSMDCAFSFTEHHAMRAYWGVDV
jgi:hypothetical protein